MKPLSPCLVVDEASGGYEGMVAAALVEAGLPVAIVNPRQVRKFTGAIGRLAKTDAIDAAVIAHFAGAVRPQPRPLPDDLLVRLQKLMARRRQLVIMINAEKQRLARAQDRIAQSSFKAVTKRLEAERARIDKLIEASPVWCAKQDLLKSVPGISNVIARTMIAELPELGQVDRHQIAALAGVAPMNWNSGRYRGKRKIQGGRVAVRATLYMACLVAIQHNPALKRFYRRLPEPGKPARLALVAAMRKLLTILKAMLRTRRPWALPRAERRSHGRQPPQAGAGQAPALN